MKDEKNDDILVVSDTTILQSPQRLHKLAQAQIPPRIVIAAELGEEAGSDNPNPEEPSG